MPKILQDLTTALRPVVFGVGGVVGLLLMALNLLEFASGQPGCRRVTRRTIVLVKSVQIIP